MPDQQPSWYLPSEYLLHVFDLTAQAMNRLEELHLKQKWMGKVTKLAVLLESIIGEECKIDTLSKIAGIAIYTDGQYDPWVRDVADIYVSNIFGRLTYDFEE